MRSRYARDLLTHFLNVYIPFEMWFFFCFFLFKYSLLALIFFSNFTHHTYEWSFHVLVYLMRKFSFITLLCLYIIFYSLSVWLCRSSWASHMNALCVSHWRKTTRTEGKRKTSRLGNIHPIFGKCLFHELIYNSEFFLCFWLTHGWTVNFVKSDDSH